MKSKQIKRPASAKTKPARKPEMPRAKAGAYGDAALAALTDILRHAEASGQRDLPHVARAREVVDQAEKQNR
jgi:hypothetical protein